MTEKTSVTWLGLYDHNLRTQTCFRLSLVSAENNVCKPEPGDDFCDVVTFVSPWPIRLHDRMKLECSSQKIPCAVVLGQLELNCDWLKIPTSQKSFPGSGSKTLFSAETSNRRKYVCVRRLLWSWRMSVVSPTGWFAYKSIRLHVLRCFAYTEVDSPTTQYRRKVN